MKKKLWLMWVVLSMILSSCSHDNYLNSIPKNCKALMSIDAESAELPDSLRIDFEGSGIDFFSDVYLFETNDGLFGGLARVDDIDKTKSWLQKRCGTLTEKKGIIFTFYKNSWVIGLNDDQLLLMGPVVATQQTQVQVQMVRMMMQDEKRSIRQSPLYKKLETIDAPVKFVAQVDALPEQMAVPFTLGVPQEANVSQVLLAAKVKKENGVLSIEGSTFSTNSKIDAALREARKHFVVSKDDEVSIPSAMPLSLVMKFDDGKVLLDMFRQNKSLQVLLAGANTAIDMDKIILNAQKHIAIGYDKQIVVAAPLKDDSFVTKDVEYWKQSCPEGASISNHGVGEWLFRSADNSYLFGVNNCQFYVGSKELTQKSEAELPAHVKDAIDEEPMFLLMNMRAHNSIIDAVKAFVPSVFLADTEFVLFVMRDEVTQTEQ